jgi:hypothetical protein
MAIKHVVALGFYDDEFVPTFGFTPGAATYAPVLMLELLLGYDTQLPVGLTCETQIGVAMAYDTQTNVLMGYDDGA